jgi:hypothetical protein
LEILPLCASPPHSGHRGATESTASTSVSFKKTPKSVPLNILSQFMHKTPLDMSFPNYRKLLWFWEQYYLREITHDHKQLEYSSGISFKFWRLNVEALCGQQGIPNKMENESCDGNHDCLLSKNEVIWL